MSALTAAKVVPHKEPARIVSMKMGAVKLWQGSLCMIIAAAGYAVAATPTAASIFAGIAAETVDNSAGSAGDKSIQLFQTGLHEIAISGVAVTDIGKKVYAETSNPSDCKDASDTPTANGQCIGRTVNVENSKAWVDIGIGWNNQELAP